MIVEISRGERGQLRIPIAGVTLVAVLLLISVQGLLMGQAAEELSSVIRHDLEEELIFRGEAWQRAVEQYLKEHGNQLPKKREDLCPKEKANRRYIRRCYSDPMTGEDFRFLGPQDVGKRRRENEARRLAAEGEDVLEEFGDPDRTTSRGRERRKSDLGGFADVKLVLPGSESHIEMSGDKPFIGVASDATERSYKVYGEGETYDEWEFVAVTQQPQNNSRRPTPTPTPSTR